MDVDLHAHEHDVEAGHGVDFHHEQEVAVLVAIGVVVHLRELRDQGERHGLGLHDIVEVELRCGLVGGVRRQNRRRGCIGGGQSGRGTLNADEGRSIEALLPAAAAARAHRERELVEGAALKGHDEGGLGRSDGRHPTEAMSLSRRACVAESFARAGRRRAERLQADLHEVRTDERQRHRRCGGVGDEHVSTGNGAGAGAGDAHAGVGQADGIRVVSPGALQLRQRGDDGGGLCGAEPREEAGTTGQQAREEIREQAVVRAVLVGLDKARIREEDVSDALRVGFILQGLLAGEAAHSHQEELVVEAAHAGEGPQSDRQFVRLEIVDQNKSCVANAANHILLRVHARGGQRPGQVRQADRFLLRDVDILHKGLGNALQQAHAPVLPAGRGVGPGGHGEAARGETAGIDEDVLLSGLEELRLAQLELGEAPQQIDELEGLEGTHLLDGQTGDHLHELWIKVLKPAVCPCQCGQTPDIVLRMARTDLHDFELDLEVQRLETKVGLVPTAPAVFTRETSETVQSRAEVDHAHARLFDMCERQQTVRVPAVSNLADGPIQLRVLPGRGAKAVVPRLFAGFLATVVGGLGSLVAWAAHVDGHRSRWRAHS
mmetsp:Transcript_32124/g.101980  ORF Transcript_32124/g.101980 Transcript_32124/m.101980 type:complete len:604 (+) Transcript_32124:1138-2949(+)